LNPILTELRQIDEEKRNKDGKFIVPVPKHSSRSQSQSRSMADPDTTPTSSQPTLPPIPTSANDTDQEVTEEEVTRGEEEQVEYFEPPKGQALLAGLLQDNFDICQDIKAREGEEDVARGPLQAIYDRLSEIKAQLERLVLTHRWTLRETVSDPFSLSNSSAGS
jgi:hypothetical protein